jgi:hypothetical protein
MSHIQAEFETYRAARGQNRIGPPRTAKRPPVPKVPHIAKLMALAIRLDHLLESRQIKDQAELARTACITRARVTQVLNLTNLAPDIQRAILELPPALDSTPCLREKEVRSIAIEPNWIKQRKAWKSLISQRSPTPSER